MLLITGFVALGFATIHVLAGQLRFLDKTPRNVWLSFAGGVSVAYVFVHLLPELAEHDERLGGSYAVALLGLALFYGMERLVRRSKGETGAAPLGVFRVHLGAFALYNALIGYLLAHREGQDARGLAIYATAMALHFIVNDQGLREHHGAAYARARWLLAAAPLVGWTLGAATELSGPLVAALFSLLAGGVVLNVLKEELPEERESRFWAFAGGAAGYAALLLLGR